MRKYLYLRIFSLTNSQSQKLIPKADLRWECPYFYSKYFFWRFLINILKSQQNYCYIKQLFDWGREHFLAENFSKKAKLPQICLGGSLVGSKQETQIKWCLLTPPQQWHKTLSKRLGLSKKSRKTKTHGNFFKFDQDYFFQKITTHVHCIWQGLGNP